MNYLARLWFEKAIIKEVQVKEPSESIELAIPEANSIDAVVNPSDPDRLPVVYVMVFKYDQKISPSVVDYRFVGVKKR